MLRKNPLEVLVCPGNAQGAVLGVLDILPLRAALKPPQSVCCGSLRLEEVVLLGMFTEITHGS